MIWEEGPQFLLPWWRCYLHFWWYILRKELPSRCLLKKVGSRAFLIFVRQNFRAPGNNNYNSAKVKNFKTLTFMPFVAVLLKVQILSRHEGHLISLRFKIRFRICSIERFPFPSFSDFTIIQEITRTSKQDRQTAANCRYWAASKLKMLFIKKNCPSGPLFIKDFIKRLTFSLGCRVFVKLLKTGH